MKCNSKIVNAIRVIGVSFIITSSMPVMAQYQGTAGSNGGNGGYGGDGGDGGFFTAGGNGGRGGDGIWGGDGGSVILVNRPNYNGVNVRNGVLRSGSYDGGGGGRGGIGGGGGRGGNATFYGGHGGNGGNGGRGGNGGNAIIISGRGTVLFVNSGFMGANGGVGGAGGAGGTGGGGGGGLFGNPGGGSSGGSYGPGANGVGFFVSDYARLEFPADAKLSFGPSSFTVQFAHGRSVTSTYKFGDRTGQIGVVPEPGAVATTLIFSMGLTGLLLWSRRKSRKPGSVIIVPGESSDCMREIVHLTK